MEDMHTRGVDTEKMPSYTPVATFRIQSKALNLVVAGYALAALGFVAFLATNGTSSGISELISIVAVSLITAGLLLATGGLLMVRRGLGNKQLEERRSLSLQGLGLVILFLGVVLVAFSSSLSAYLISATLVIASGTSALAGAILLQKHYVSIHAMRQREGDYLVLAMALIFSGVGLIVGSNIAFYYILSQAGSTIYADVGATATAYGCVLAAYSLFVFRSHKKLV